MAFLYVAGLEVSTWDSDLPWASDTELSVTSSGKPTRRPSSWRGWKTRPWIQLLSGTLSNPSTASAGVESWISWLRASLASHTALQAKVEAPKTSVTCGPMSAESSTNAVQLSFFSRTSRELSDSFGITYCLTYEDWVIALRRDYSARQRLARRNGGSGSSSWPTPTQSDRKASGRRNYAACHDGDTLTDAAVRLWPTPRPGVHGQPGNHPNAVDSIGEAAKQWATPQARDGKGQRGNHTKGGRDLTQDASGHQDPTALQKTGQKMCLNPAFVEALMGLAPGWNDWRPLETLSFLRRQPSPSAVLRSGSRLVSDA